MSSPLFDIYDVVFIPCKLALVSQDLELFTGSLRYNIKYGLKGCTDEKVRDAVKKAKADAIVSELKDQYDTGTNTHTLVLSYENIVCMILGLSQTFNLLDESEITHRRSCVYSVSATVCFPCAAMEGGGGATFQSSGLRHSVALIRALVQDPRVIILDETTSKVDTDVWHAVSNCVLIEIFYSGALGLQVCLFYSSEFKKLNMVQLSLCYSEGPVQMSINALGTGLSQINENKYRIFRL